MRDSAREAIAYRYGELRARLEVLLAAFELGDHAALDANLRRVRELAREHDAWVLSELVGPSK